MRSNHITKVWLRIRQSWQPKENDPPAVDPMFSTMDAVQRSAETFRYSILSVEFWISPNGQVREWLRHNTRLAAWLAIPAFLILPVVGFILWQLVAIAGRLVVFPILGLLAALAIVVVINVAKAVFE